MVFFLYRTFTVWLEKRGREEFYILLSIAQIFEREQ